MAARQLACALALGAGLSVAQAQPQTQTPPKESSLSERQAERVAQRERLIECNRRAREAKLRSAQRQAFIQDCLKGDTAAVGGGRGK